MSDPTTRLFQALHEYIRATHPRCTPVWVTIVTTDGSKIKLRVQVDYGPPAEPEPASKEKK